MVCKMLIPASGSQNPGQWPDELITGARRQKLGIQEQVLRTGYSGLGLQDRIFRAGSPVPDFQEQIIQGLPPEPDLQHRVSKTGYPRPGIQNRVFRTGHSGTGGGLQATAHLLPKTGCPRTGVQITIMQVVQTTGNHRKVGIRQKDQLSGHSLQTPGFLDISSSTFRGNGFFLVLTGKKL